MYPSVPALSMASAQGGAVVVLAARGSRCTYHMTYRLAVASPAVSIPNAPKASCVLLFYCSFLFFVFSCSILHPPPPLPETLAMLTLPRRCSWRWKKVSTFHPGTLATNGTA